MKSYIANNNCGSTQSARVSSPMARVVERALDALEIAITIALILSVTAAYVFIPEPGDTDRKRGGVWPLTAVGISIGVAIVLVCAIGLVTFLMGCANLIIEAVS